MDIEGNEDSTKGASVLDLTYHLSAYRLLLGVKATTGQNMIILAS